MPLMPEDERRGSFDSGPPPDPGAVSDLAFCANPRALALKYTAKEGKNLPQAKAVKSVPATWAKSRGLKNTRLAVLDCLD